MKRSNFFLSVLLLSVVLFFSACSEDSTDPTGNSDDSSTVSVKNFALTGGVWRSSFMDTNDGEAFTSDGVWTNWSDGEWGYHSSADIVYLSEASNFIIVKYNVHTADYGTNYTNRYTKKAWIDAGTNGDGRSVVQMTEVIEHVTNFTYKGYDTLAQAKAASTNGARYSYYTNYTNYTD